MSIDASLVRRLLVAQFPEWAALPVVPVESAGTDNAIYRLGEEMAVRLPRLPRAAGQVEKEQRWLPHFARHLPLAIPAPLGRGAPAEGYPWHWSVYNWLDGENANVGRIADPRRAASRLAQFVTALQRIDTEGAPRSGPHNEFRGVPLALRDPLTRGAIEALRGAIDAGAAAAVWEAALHAPPWRGAPVWLHGDLQPGNLLVVRGELTAVIDFGLMGVGDPACDAIVAWTLFGAEARDVFRSELRLDDATWTRGRGWALSTASIALVAYVDTNPVLAGISRRAITEVLGGSEGGA